MQYRQIKLSDRKVIQKRLDQGKKQKTIAAKLGFTESAISREIARNSIGGEYWADQAHQLYLARRRQNIKYKKDNRKLFWYVLLKLMLRWSPEQIAMRMQLLFPDKTDMKISHETIYKWIYDLKVKGITLYQFLRLKNKKYHKRGRISNDRALKSGYKSIHDRPEVVEENVEAGHWEGDIVEGGKSTAYIATFVERVSKYLVAQHLETKRSKNFAEKTKSAFQKIKTQLIKTITYDNGSEMADFETIETSLKCQVYFADPGSPWQRGLNENTNGLLRQFFPKGSDFRKFNQKELDIAVELLNHRPRKNLGYRTPYEAFFGHLPTDNLALPN